MPVHILYFSRSYTISNMLAAVCTVTQKCKF